MKKAHLGIVFFSVLSLLPSVSAQAGEKVTGRDFDIQTLSESTAAIPDKPGHSLKQVTEVWKSTTSLDPETIWVSVVSQREVLSVPNAGKDIKMKGYGTEHYNNGDVSYFVWEGNAKVTPKEAGAFDRVEQGTFSWIGGTGKPPARPEHGRACLRR